MIACTATTAAMRMAEDWNRAARKSGSVYSPNRRRGAAKKMTTGTNPAPKPAPNQTPSSPPA